MAAVLIRLVAVATVLLAMALMAVSAYAARIEVRTAPSPGDAGLSEEELSAGAVATPIAGAAAIDDTPLTLDAYAIAAEAAEREQAATNPLSAPAQAIPVPLDAAAVGLTNALGSNDLSLPRVWSVISIPPVPASLIASGGLDIPPDQLAVMLQVSGWSGVPWQVLAAIAKVESNFGRNMATSSAGAIGYGQFLPAMWAVFGQGGDPYDFRDALPAMARYLIHAGVHDDVAEALYAYNHSWSYVSLVLSYATAYGYPGSGASASGLVWPSVGPISTYFEPPRHTGIDIDQTMKPGTPVLAAHDGVVSFAGGDPCCGYGYYVMLVSPAGITTLYAHFESIGVALGQTVRQGQALGIVGCTGRCTGTHLHFEVSEGGVRRDPLEYLP